MDLHKRIFALAPDVRYVAVYREGQLTMRSRGGTQDASDEETDRYEELLVNPTLLKLATQRGDIDCGGLDYLILRYGHFFQFVLPMAWGHVSVCFEPTADPVALGARVRDLVQALLG
ncbi:MAG: hypothetical protein AAGN66_29985 [Acidobacteriota bacterium]